jgi:hypothetical protein
VLITICMGSADDAHRALDDAEVSLLTVLDENGRASSAYRVGGTPTLYLIAADGTILMSDIGYGTGTEEHLRQEIQRLLR